MYIKTCQPKNICYFKKKPEKSFPKKKVFKEEKFSPAKYLQFIANKPTTNQRQTSEKNGQNKSYDDRFDCFNLFNVNDG